MPAEANALAIRSFRAWCLADLPGARLQAKLWRPCASTSEPQRRGCGVHNGKPSLKATAIIIIIMHKAAGLEIKLSKTVTMMEYYSVSLLLLLGRIAVLHVLAFYIWGAHWRHLAHTTQPSMCGGNVPQHLWTPGLSIYGCTLAPPGEYDWIVHALRRFGLMLIYVDHLLLLLSLLCELFSSGSVL